MAVAMPVFSPKQSARLAATLYSPPETWISTERAFRNGSTPGSSRVTTAPSESRSSSHGSVRTFKLLISAPVGINRVRGDGRRHESRRSDPGPTGGPSTFAVDVDVHLEGLLVFQELHHLPVVVEAGDGVGEDPLGDAGIGELAVRQGLDAQLEVASVAVDARDEQLVAEHPLEVDLRGVEGDLLATAGDAGPDQGAIDREHLHGPEAGLGVAGGLEDQVGLADLSGEVGQGGLPRAHVRGAIGLGDLRLAMRAGLGGEGEDLEAAEPEHHGGEQPDLAGAQDEGPSGIPDLQPLLREVG